MLGGLFSTLEDRRTAKGRRYALEPILCSLLLAMLSGATSLRKMQAFIDERLDVLNALFGTHWTSAPSWVGIRRILLGIDAAELEQAVRHQARRLSGLPPPEGMIGIAIDGKALRGSACQVTDVRARQLVSAFVQDQHIVLGHVEIDQRSNEIPAAQALMDSLGRPGYLFTLDAMHCQKNAGHRTTPWRPRRRASQGQPARAA